MINKENEGVTSAHNSGLEHVMTSNLYKSVEYLTFVDSDDILKLDVYESAYHKAKEDNVDTLVFGFDGFPSTKSWYEVCGNPENKIFKVEKIDKILKSNLDHIHVWNKLYKKSLCKYTRYENGLQLFEDSFLNFLTFADAKI